MTVVRIPSVLRALTGGRDEVSAEGATVGEVLEALVTAHPGLRARLFDEKGALRRYVNVFHNDEDIRYLQALATPVSEGDRLALLPAMAGG